MSIGPAPDELGEQPGAGPSDSVRNDSSPARSSELRAIPWHGIDGDLTSPRVRAHAATGGCKLDVGSRGELPAALGLGA